MKQFVLTLLSMLTYLAMVGFLAGGIYLLLVRMVGLDDRQLIAIFLAVLILDVVYTRKRAYWRRPDGQKKAKK